MGTIRGQHTKPEMRVRRALWARGLRYRLHARDLPGRPDLVMRGRQLAIFVHGCLWHLHQGCKLARVPKSRPDYWPAKLARNQARDKRNVEELLSLGWSVEWIWECETADPQRLQSRLDQILAASR
jgi:DNA mismatch endonuclease Vsr